MKSWKTNKDNKIFKVLSGRSNAYYLKSLTHNILFDTGKVSAYKKLMRNISMLNPKNKNVDLLVLTHTHFDHCQNAAQIKNQAKCRIAMSEIENECAKTGYTPVSPGTMFFSKVISKVGSQMSVKRFCYEPFVPDILISHSFLYEDYDLNIKIIETPGHSPGSISIIVDDEIALVGDTLFGVFPNSVFPPFADDPIKLIKSWNELLKTPCTLFLPGHGNAISRKRLKKEYFKFPQKYCCRSAV